MDLSSGPRGNPLSLFAVTGRRVEVDYFARSQEVTEKPKLVQLKKRPDRKPCMTAEREVFSHEGDCAREKDLAALGRKRPGMSAAGTQLLLQDRSSRWKQDENFKPFTFSNEPIKRSSSAGKLLPLLPRLPNPELLPLPFNQDINGNRRSFETRGTEITASLENLFRDQKVRSSKSDMMVQADRLSSPGNELQRRHSEAFFVPVVPSQEVLPQGPSWIERQMLKQKFRGTHVAYSEHLMMMAASEESKVGLQQQVSTTDTSGGGTSSKPSSADSLESTTDTNKRASSASNLTDSLEGHRMDEEDMLVIRCSTTGVAYDVPMDCCSKDSLDDGVSEDSLNNYSAGRNPWQQQISEDDSGGEPTTGQLVSPTKEDSRLVRGEVALSTEEQIKSPRRSKGYVSFFIPIKPKQAEEKRPDPDPQAVSPNWLPRSLEKRIERRQQMIAMRREERRRCGVEGVETRHQHRDLISCHRPRSDGDSSRKKKSPMDELALYQAMSIIERELMRDQQRKRQREQSYTQEEPVVVSRRTSSHLLSTQLSAIREDTEREGSGHSTGEDNKPKTTPLAAKRQRPSRIPVRVNRSSQIRSQHNHSNQRPTRRLLAKRASSQEFNRHPRNQNDRLEQLLKPDHVFEDLRKFQSLRSRFLYHQNVNSVVDANGTCTTQTFVLDQKPLGDNHRASYDSESSSSESATLVSSSPTNNRTRIPQPTSPGPMSNPRSPRYSKWDRSRTPEGILPDIYKRPPPFYAPSEQSLSPQNNNSQHHLCDMVYDGSSWVLTMAGSAHSSSRVESRMKMKLSFSPGTTPVVVTNSSGSSLKRRRQQHHQRRSSDVSRSEDDDQMTYGSSNETSPQGSGETDRTLKDDACF